MPASGAVTISNDEANAVFQRIGGSSKLTVLDCACFRPLFSKMRAAATPSPEFASAARRLMTVLAEEAVARLPSRAETVKTPCGEYQGVVTMDASEVCAVSIMRAGDSLLESIRGIWPAVSVGKILIQRDEETALPRLFYTKLPPGIASKWVMLLDPMLATGGSAVQAIKCIVDAGVPPSRIMLVTVVVAMQGVITVLEAYPDVQIVTAALDAGLNEKAYIVPGLGDFGDRFYGTDA